MIVSRRSLLSVVAATALPFRRQAIRFAIAPGASAVLTAGVRFGVHEAERAAVLLGKRIELASHAAIQILANAGIQIDGAVFSVRADPGAYDQARLDGRQAAGGRNMRVTEWHHSLYKYGASELNERFFREAGSAMQSEHWLGWMAVKVIVDASLRNTSGPLADAIIRGRFDGHKGVALAFSKDTRHLRQPLYVVDPESDRVIWPA